MKQSNNQSKELGCEYCSGENDKPGWKGGFSDDGYIGYTQCFSCNEDGQRDEAMNSTKGDNTPTNTLEDNNREDILDILREGKKAGYAPHRPSQLELRRQAQADKLLYLISQAEILMNALLVWKQDYARHDGDNGLLLDEYFDRLEVAKNDALKAIDQKIAQAVNETNMDKVNELLAKS